MLIRKVPKNTRKKFFIVLVEQLNVCKKHWCSHMVRHRKHPVVKQAYNQMFENLFTCISTMQQNTDKLSGLEKHFLDSVVYTGLLYREIGFPVGYENHPKYILDLEYDDSYCSWNANDNLEKIHHIRDGYRYNIRITAKATAEYFGFSITGFNMFYNKKFGGKNHNMPNEDEVVLKLRKETVISTEKIFLNSSQP